MANRSIKIEVDVDEKGAVRRIRSIDGSLVDLRKTAKTTKRSAFDLGQAFNVAVGQGMVVAAAAAGRAIRGLIREGAELVGMSADIFETQNKFNAVFRSGAGDVQQFNSEFAALAGLTQTAGREFLATTGAILQGAGFASEASAEMSVEVARLAGDLTSFTNIPIEDTFGAIQSALVGERERLKRLGIVLRETEVQQVALAMSGKRAAAELTVQDKATAALTLITQKAGAAIGDLEKTQNSAANQMRQIQAKFGDLREELAVELLPAITLVATELNNFLSDPELSANARAIGEGISESLVDAITVIKSVIGFLATYRDEIATGARVTGVLTAALIAYRIAASGATAATALFNSTLRLNPIGAVASLLTLAVGALFAFKGGVDDTEVALRQMNAELEASKIATEDLTAAQMDARRAQIIADQSVLGAEAARLRSDRDKLRQQAQDLAAKGGRPDGLLAAAARVQQEIDATLAKIEANGFALAELYRLAQQGPDLDTGGGGGGGDDGPVTKLGKDVEIDVDPEGDFQAALDAETQARENAEETFEAMNQRRLASARERYDAEQEMAEEAIAAEVARQQRLEQAEEARLAAQKQAVLASMQADASQIQSARDAASAVVASIKQVIKARLAESIATAIAKLPFPANLILGPAAGVALAVLFDKVIPQFAMGARGFAGGPAIVGEKGPELVRLPGGASVTPAFQTNRMLDGGAIEVVVTGKLQGETIHLSGRRAERRLSTMGRA